MCGSDLNVKRLEALVYDNTLCFQQGWKEEQNILQKGEIHTFIYMPLHSIQHCFLLLILPLSSKFAVFHMEEVAKMKVFPFFPQKTSSWLELASCSYSTWLNQSFSLPTLAPSAARLSSRARCQQSRLLWEEKVLSLEFHPYTLQGASLWSMGRIQRATSSLPRSFPCSSVKKAAEDMSRRIKHQCVFLNMQF